MSDEEPEGSPEPLEPDDLPPDDYLEDDRKRPFKLFLIAGIVAFAAVAVYLGFLVATQADEILFPGNEIEPGPVIEKLPGIDSGETPESADVEERINLLVLGLDRKLGGAVGFERTDTVFVMSVDPYSKTAGVFSIPRDLVVNIPNGRGGFFQDRINVAYQYGESVLEGYPGGGPGLAMDTVELNFKIPLDHYAVIDFEAFIGLVDEIGGIEVNVPVYRSSTNFANCEGCRGYFVEFFPGLQHMNGEAALTYARIRQGTDDLDRIDRQQLIMMAIAEQAIGLDLLLPNNLVSLFDRYDASVDTSISAWQVPGFAALISGIGVDQMKTVSINDAVQLGVLGDASVLYADWEKVNQLKNQIFLDGVLQMESALIHLHNGSADQGLATSIADFLKAQGMAPENVVELQSGDGPVQPATRIYNLNGKIRTSETLAQWLGLTPDQVVDGNEVEASPFMASGADIYVVLGSDASVPDPAALAGGG